MRGTSCPPRRSVRRAGETMKSPNRYWSLGIDPGFRISRFRVTVGVNESVFDDFAQTWREAGVPD